MGSRNLFHIHSGVYYLWLDLLPTWWLRDLIIIYVVNCTGNVVYDDVGDRVRDCSNRSTHMWSGSQSYTVVGCDKQGWWMKDVQHHYLFRTLLCASCWSAKHKISFFTVAKLLKWIALATMWQGPTFICIHCFGGHWWITAVWEQREALHGRVIFCKAALCSRLR